MENPGILLLRASIVIYYQFTIDAALLIWAVFNNLILVIRQVLYDFQMILI